MNEETLNKILKMYRANMSTHEIAEKMGTYPNKINRALKKAGEPLRGRGEAQKVALASGRHEHPTEGRKRTEKERINISNGAAKYWENADEETKQKKSQQAKEKWDAMSLQDKEDFLKAASEGIRKAAKNGSKIELFLLDKLTQNGYNIVFHAKHLVEGEDLETDLFVPDLKTVIEIDGPSHFFPIWGADHLNKQIKSDNKKSGRILSMGMVMIRVKYLCKNSSQKQQRDLANTIISELIKIRSKFPAKGKRLVELEIK
jgi:very-short-patch-repair endonuclease